MDRQDDQRLVQSFDNEVEGAQLEGGHGILRAGMGGQQDDRDGGIPTVEMLQNLQAGHPGHAQVQQDQVQSAIAYLCQGRHPLLVFYTWYLPH